MVFLLKLSILLQYLRTFVPLKTRNAMFWTCHALIWLNFVFYLVSFFLVIFNCTPIEKSWNSWIKGRCLNFDMISIAAGVINTISDLLILILPQFVIWNLQLSTKKRLRISGVFLPGALWVQPGHFSYDSSWRGQRMHICHYTVILCRQNTWQQI